MIIEAWITVERRRSTGSFSGRGFGRQGQISVLSNGIDYQQVKKPKGVSLAAFVLRLCFNPIERYSKRLKGFDNGFLRVKQSRLILKWLHDNGLRDRKDQEWSKVWGPRKTWRGGPTVTRIGNGGVRSGRYVFFCLLIPFELKNYRTCKGVGGLKILPTG